MWVTDSACRQDLEKLGELTQKETHPLPQDLTSPSSGRKASIGQQEKSYGSQGHLGIQGIPLNAGCMFPIEFSVTELLVTGMRWPSQLALDLNHQDVH